MEIFLKVVRKIFSILKTTNRLVIFFFKEMFMPIICLMLGIILLSFVGVMIYSGFLEPQFMVPIIFLAPVFMVGSMIVVYGSIESLLVSLMPSYNLDLD